jgi:SAM-dependent methyltransferase
VVAASTIDHGRPFDWSRASDDYAAYRDIYPKELFDKLAAMGIGVRGQTVVDLGTGTGVVPLGLAGHGARFIGVDLSTRQIEHARRLSGGVPGSFGWIVAAAEATGLSAGCADIVMACQSLVYFDKSKLVPELLRLLRPGGRFVRVTMNWLPSEDTTARRTEELIVKYNPDWTGAGKRRLPLEVSDWSREKFTPETLHTFDAHLPFTHESWRGRIRACRGMGASSISDEAKAAFEREHTEMLEQTVPDRFAVLHQVKIEVLKVKECEATDPKP